MASLESHDTARTCHEGVFRRREDRAFHSRNSSLELKFGSPQPNQKHQPQRYRTTLATVSLRLRAGLAWATPVHPVTLLNHLDSYWQALPNLHSLRLCWKFGKGKDVHITTLPVEIEQAIEHLLIKAEHHNPERNYLLGRVERMREFDCFESICLPSSHRDDMTPPLLNWVEERAEYCDVCGEKDSDGYLSSFSKADKCRERCSSETGLCSACQVPGCEAADSERTCFMQYENFVDEVYEHQEGGYDTHWSRQKSWYQRIEQAQDTERTESDRANQPRWKGDRARLTVGHSRILRKYFGLDIHLADTTFDSISGTCPKHNNHRFNDAEKKTTLCYLTLPKKRSGSISLHEKDGDMDPADVRAARAMRVDLSSLIITEEQRRRFGRAMKALFLEVFLHGSQDLGSTTLADMSASSSTGADKQGSGQGKGVLQWPQLLLLVEGS
ncbi:hypothetical protein LTR15_012556 [Elasticomyces elasticus]|nr:hypothetical protein LTR15_012556 [Elasticomyces elasticus]